MVDDMRKTLHDEEKESDTTEKKSKEEYEASQTKTETSSLVDSGKNVTSIGIRLTGVSQETAFEIDDHFISP